MTGGVDISLLRRPEVDGLLLTPDEVRDRLVADVKAETGWDISETPGDPAWRMATAIAGELSRLRSSVDDACAQNSLAYASGRNLDGLGATYYRTARKQGEADADYRQRLARSPERAAVGLSGPWYEETALGVEGVRDAEFESPAPSRVTLHVLADERLLDGDGDPIYPNGIPNAALLAAVRAAVTAVDARQQADVVTVSACTRQAWKASVTLSLPSGPDAALVVATASAALTALGERTARLGALISKELIAGAVVDPRVASGAAIALKRVDGTRDVDAERIQAGSGVALQAASLSVEAA